MPRREVTFSPGEYYHVYSRGVEGRAIVRDRFDADRFVLGLVLFNSDEPIGSIFEKTSAHVHVAPPERNKSADRLVDVIAYCLNPNHFHLILREHCEGGIVHYMRRVAGGYASYFNERYGRAGPLYESRFKAKHVDTNDYLLWLSVYVNLNDRVHSLPEGATVLVRSSFAEYQARSPTSTSVSAPGTVLEQFGVSGREEHATYEAYAQKALEDMVQRKDHERMGRELGVS